MKKYNLLFLLAGAFCTSHFFAMQSEQKKNLLVKTYGSCPKGLVKMNQHSEGLITYRAILEINGKDEEVFVASRGKGADCHVARGCTGDWDHTQECDMINFTSYDQILKIHEILKAAHALQLKKSIKK